jgi:hypothetical protein
MIVLKVNTFVFDFLSIGGEIFSTGIVPEILNFVEGITFARAALRGTPATNRSPDENLVAARATDGNFALASHRNSRVLNGFTWRPPSVEERQLAIGKSLQGPALKLYQASIFYLVEN